MNAPLTSRDVAAMTAHAAAIKTANDAYTQGRMTLGESNSGGTDVLIDGQRVARTLHGVVEPRMTAAQSHEVACRLIACWNACAGVPTETLELCARWGDVVNATVFNRVHIPAEAAAVGAVLDSESLEQGDQ